MLKMAGVGRTQIKLESFLRNWSFEIVRVCRQGVNEHMYPGSMRILLGPEKPTVS